MFPISHTAILEIVVTFVALFLRRTKFHEPEKYQNLLRKTFFLSSTCDHFLHRHKAESRLEIHWLHHEWGSDYFPIDSSTQLVCKVCDSQLLRASSSGGSKNKSLRWRRTDEVDWTLQIKHWAAFWLDKQHNSHRITSWNCFPFHMLHGDLGTQKVLVEGRNDCIKYDSALPHLESVGRCWVRWLESKLCPFCPYNCSMAIQAPAVVVAI